MFSQLAALKTRSKKNLSARSRSAGHQERKDTRRRLFLEKFEDRIVLASTLHAIPAGNIDVIENDSLNNATSVTVSTPVAFNGFQLRAGSNRGDFNVQVGDFAVDDVTSGIFMTSVRENGRDNSATGSPAGTLYGAPAIGDDTVQYWVVTQDTTSNRAEMNINSAAAYFEYENWYAGHAVNGAGTNGGVLDTLRSHQDIQLGTHFLPLGGGRATLDLTTLGINSQTDGILLVTHGKNEGNFALSRANEDGTWSIFIKDNNANGTSYEQDPMAFVFVPTSDTTVFSGKFLGDGTVEMASNPVNVSWIDEGTYRLTIPGYSPNEGVLIISAEHGNADQGEVDLNVDNVVSYEPDGNSWIIQSRDLSGSTLESPGGDEYVVSFMFIPGPEDPGITISPTSGLFTTENGGTDAFSVVLDRPPTADVTISLSSSDETEGTVSPSSVTFTPDNWFEAQIVTVTGVEDDEADGGVSYTIVTSPAVSADTDYNGVDPADVTAINIDNDQVGITVYPSENLITTEAGGQASFIVFLNSQPTADVTIGLSSSDEGEGTVTPTSLTFTSENWLDPQTVTVTGVDDFVDDGDIAYAIITAPAVSADSGFNGVNPADVQLTNEDDDTAAILVDRVSGLVTTEVGGTDSFTIVLASQPEQDVVIDFSSSNATEGTADPASVTFTSADWSVPRTITVTGADDAVGDGDQVYTIVSSVTTADPVYGTFDPADVAVTNTDNEPRIVLPSGDRTYGVGDSALGIDTLATVTDPDTASYDSGSLTVSLTSNGDANDRLEIRTDGTGAGQIGVSGTDVTYEGTVIGSYAGGEGVTPLVVTLNSDATVAAVQALMRAVTYRNVSSIPSLLTRTVRFSIDDGLGGASNDAEKLISLGMVRSVSFQEGVDHGFGIYSGAVDIQFQQSSPDTPYPTGQDELGPLVDWPNADNEGQVLLQFANLFGDGPGQIPYGATIVSATLSVDTNNTGQGSRMHRMLIPWDSENDTWNSFGSGADGRNVTPGVQADNSEARFAWDSQIGMFTGSGLTGTGVTNIGVTNDLQAWADGEANFGWLMRGWENRTDGWQFSPSEAANPADRPKLTVEWLPAGVSSTSFRNGVNGYMGGLDASLYEYDPDIDSYGVVDRFVDAANPGLDNETQSLLQFMAIVGNGVNQIPVGSQVHAATLVLASTTSDSMGHGGQFFPMLQPWIPDFLTWNTFSTGGGGVQPGVEAAATSNSQIGSADLTPLVQATYNSVDVTTDVQNWVRGTMANNGWAILPWAGGTNGWSFTASDAIESERPELRVFYTPPGITVSPTSGLFTTEDGDTAQFSIVLNTEPGADVTIGLTSSDTSEGTLSVASVTFTPENWNMPQIVTVTGVNDDDQDENVDFQIVTAAAASSDPGYNGLNADDVTITNVDNDSPGIFVTPTSGLTTTEDGGTASFAINLQTKPTANVTIDLSSSDTTEGTVAPASLIFTPSNWFLPQTVTVTGVNDFNIDGDVAYAIVTAPSVSTDTLYNDVDPADVSVINLDNDVAGITVVPTSGLVTTEAGGSDTFTVVLDTQPTADVTILLQSSDATEGTVSPTSVTFTSGNWATAQVVTVTGVNDGDDDNDVIYTIVTQAASSSDSDYSGLDAVDVEVTNLDDENQAPVVALPLGDISYGIGGIGIGIDAKATVSDSDSSKYTGGTLTVTLTANGTVDDRLSVRNDGTGEGQVGVAGTDVTFGGVVVGSLSGGEGATPLVVTFNGSATVEAVQAVLRAVTFSNVSATPSTATRTVEVVVNDGFVDGTSIAVSKNIRVGLRHVTAFQEGIDWGYGTYAGQADMQLRQANPDTVYPEGNLLVDWDGGTVNSQVLLRFDDLIGSGPGQIPEGAQIVSANLIVNTTNTGDGGTMHRMLGGWDAETETWNSFGTDVGARNSTPGIQADGVEARTAFDSQLNTASGGGATGTGTTIIGVTGDIQAWANGEANHGWAILGWNDNTDGWAFDSSEQSSDRRPLLVVDWIPAETSTVSFRQGVNGYGGTVDTRLYESFPDTDYSTATSVWTDYEDATNLDSQFLLRFDDIIGNGVSQIPFGATIHAAVLTLASVDSNAQGDGGSFHTMLTPWSDTDTWNTLNGGATPDNVQASSAYNSQAGTADLSPDVQGGFNPFDVTADVQAWVNGQANYGWAAIPWEGGTNGWGIATSEALLAQHRPELRIYFTAGPGVTLDPIANLTASEDGATAEFNVVLNSTPTDDVTITVSGDSQVEVSVNGVDFASEAVLTFTAGNALTAQAVTVRALDDAVLEGNHVGSVSLTAASADADYDAVAINDVEVAILDNETLNVEQIVINDGSDQRSMVTQLSVVFNAGVLLAADAFQVINRDTQEVVNTTFTTSLDGQGRTVATITFLGETSVDLGGSLADGNYQLTVDAAKVTYNGLELAEDIVFGDEETEGFFRLYGSGDGDRFVDFLDFVLFNEAFDSEIGEPNYNDAFDWDGDGFVDFFDFVLFNERFDSELKH